MIRPGLPTLLALLVASSGTSLAEEPPPPDLLRGPEVDRGAKESNLGMLENGVSQRAIRRVTVPVKRWFLECASLDLTPAQAAEIAALKAAFNQRSEAYLDLHKPRLKALRRQIKAHEALASKASPSPEYQALVAERALLLADAPQVTTLQQVVWSHLTPKQQDALRVLLEEVRKEIRRDRAIEQLKEQATPLPQGMQEGMQEGMPATQPGESGRPGRLPASLQGFD